MTGNLADGWAQRKRETAAGGLPRWPLRARPDRRFGVRLALGAARAQILSLVVGQGLAMAGVGCATGIVASVALADWLKGLVSGMPGWRAARIDPNQALREE